jgi:EAL domain-containing protein (putative c-di-GMP-specific phosphodiesterase class I)
MDASSATYVSRIDAVTQLPNRQQYVSDYQASSVAELVMLTLADAKQFNQLLRAVGHEYSEYFMRAGAFRIAEAAPPGAVIYHVSILSFVFFAPEGASAPALQKIIEAFETPVLCAGIPISSDIALGIASCSDTNPSVALRAALAAAQDSRETGAAWARYNRKTDSAHQRGFLLLSHLSAAIEAPDQLSLHYQPKYDMATGRITSAEALLRWQHPVYGAISPAEFIPLAEATAHIHALTAWVTRHAIAQAGAWAAKGHNIAIAINVSPRNLSRSGFAAQLSQILKYYGVAPSAIELEFTEGVLANNDLVVLDELQTLRQTGIRIALDDFGTGFANFSYITHLPADIIKIDRSFIRKIGADPRSALLVRTLIELAHNLDYRVVAEGIETERAYTMLTEWKCDEGQGYLMSRPLSVAQFAEAIDFTRPLQIAV